MDLSAKPLINPAAAYRLGGDGWAVLVNLDTARSLALNPTSVVVWRLVNGKRSIAEIIAATRQYFRDAPPTVSEDVSALLAILIEEGLIGFEWTPGV
jgi:hypothetical protein